MNSCYLYAHDIKPLCLWQIFGYLA